MKTLVGILSILLLVACQKESSYNNSKFKTFMVKTSGKIETLPDEASFYISLNCLERTVTSSKKCLVEKSNELNKKLVTLGIDQDDILTTSVEMNKRYTWVKNSRVFQGYNSSTRMIVTVKDINSLDEIYSELLENRNLDLGGLQYTHSKIDSLKNEAYVNALKKANILADKLLMEIPESNKEILKIGNVEISASMPQQNNRYNETIYEEAEEIEVQNQSVAISTGTVVVHATLFVEYQIE